MKNTKLVINKSNINKISEIVEACEYWSYQKKRAQEMIKLCDDNLESLHKELIELESKNINTNTHKTEYEVKLK